MTIFVCGDSTAATYAPDRAPITGWGQVLGEFIPGVRIVNKAMGGRSTKSFLADGRLVDIEKEMQPGDLLLIQFTHNDTSDLVWRHTDPHTSFAANLELFVDTARVHDAIPVLMTPIPRRWWREGKIANAHGEYPDAIRRVAKQKAVPLLDVLAESTRVIESMGDEATCPLYMNVEPGIYPAYPDGSKDDTHTQRAGAEFFARITAELLKKQHLI
ncbi:MAG: rhamnogalacturonan acetylesterase [Clostridia bacterium]|nr:rhamnogalacturonan acetylesterase [Clostridia bacterium]